jgi:dynein light intermediate chain 1
LIVLLCRPSGWDNQKKINILYENMHSCKPEDDFNEIIAQPPSRKAVSNRETEVHTEDEQSFLSRQLQQLQQGQQGQQQTRSVSPMRTPQSGGKTSSRTPNSQGSPSKKVNTALK